MPVGVREVDFAKNPEPRCPCVLLLDTSGSMDGEPIRELNDGLKLLQEALNHNDLTKKRVELALVTFGGTPTVVREFSSIEQFVPPQLSADGETPMGAAIEKALDMVEDCKRIYKANGILYFRPWAFLITDGAPTDSWSGAAQRIRDGEANKKFSFYAVGVEGADMGKLAQIAPPSRPPLMLRGLDFASLFVWLSSSLGKVSSANLNSDTMVPLEPATGWAQAPTS